MRVRPSRALRVSCTKAEISDLLGPERPHPDNKADISDLLGPERLNPDNKAEISDLLGPTTLWHLGHEPTRHRARAGEFVA